MNKEIPPAIPIAIEFMKKSFGGTDVEIVSEAYRLEPSEDAPAGALGCDIHIKIPNHQMHHAKIGDIIQLANGKNAVIFDIVETPTALEISAVSESLRVIVKRF